MYLDPQDGKEPMFKAAVRLLHNHGESLDPLQVLEVSDSLPLIFGNLNRIREILELCTYPRNFFSSLRFFYFKNSLRLSYIVEASWV